MSIDISASLNERQRNALLSYYMGQYIPASGNDDLVNLVQTPEDVYEYLLIDPLVSNAVPTSRVAQAMSSIQQYINGITMNMEPGYQTQFLDQDNIDNWKSGLSQYDIWAGEVELDTYPENYIDPTLRQSQTAYFKDLITDLNQNTINSDTAQQAVMSYLNKFEQVANLTIVGGYLDSTDQTDGVYYFLGKSTTSPVQYYWRSFDMSKNVDNVVSTDAWSEWYPMNAAINNDAIKGIPRIAYFNNRLYLFWFEVTTGGNNTQNGVPDGTTWRTITAYSSYCDFSNNWTSPYILDSIDEGGDTDWLFSTTWPCTIAMYDLIDDCMVVSLYSGTYDNAGEETDYSDPDSIDGYDDFSLNIDYWFNITKVSSASSSDEPTSLAEYQWHYLANTTRPTAQNQVQTNYALGGFNIGCDEISSHDDFEGEVVLPSINKHNFTIEPEGYSLEYTLNGTIPCSDVFESSTFSWQNQVIVYNNNVEDNEKSDLGHMSGSIDTGFASCVKNLILNYDIADVGGWAVDHVIVSIGDWREIFNIDLAYFNYGGTLDLSKYVFNTAPFKINASDTVDIKVCQTGGDSFYLRNTVDLSSKSLDPINSTFQLWEDKNEGCWRKTGLNPIINQSQTSFSAQAAPWKFSISDFSSDELSADVIDRYVAFGYLDNENYSINQEVRIKLTRQAAVPLSPVITKGTDTDNGSAVYLTFSDGMNIDPIRLNTLFAKELINKASASIQALLNWDTQLTLEPPMITSGTGNSTPMDFSGANGLYFWELFFYMPYLVAWRLSQEAEYSDALAWYNYIFDPAARGRDNSSDIRKQYPEPDYWSVRPLVESTSSAVQGSAAWLTTDPDALASAYPIHYQKAVFMAYVSTLMAAADASYRLLTNDGLSLARLQYGQVKDLLGIRPDTLIVNHWTPETLEELAESTESNVALMSYEQQTAALPAFPGQLSAAMDTALNDSFMAPVNSQLLGYWNTLDSRLYNLRHQLTIDGQPMSVPLYAPPVNPTVLMEQSVQGGSLISASSGMTATIPPYRFITMLQSARSAVSTLSQFGQTMLGYYERKDAAGLQELDAQLALDLSAYNLTLGQNAIDALDQDKTALEASRSMAQQRYDHYFTLYNKGVSAGETSAMALRTSASVTSMASSPLISTGFAMRAIPNIFGFSDGGEELGAPENATGAVLQLEAEGYNLLAQQTEISESYRRRSEEWQIQYQQAQSEVDTLNAQLDALAVRRQGAVTSLQLAQAQQDNLKSTLSFLTTRFTQSSLYNWLTGQLSALYYQAYDAVLSLCLSAQACWQYEMGDMTSTFIQTGAWNDSYHGLLVGETLTLNLQQMESAWLSRNVRRLELTKTVSLKQLDSDAFSGLLSDGTTQFSLGESLFDNDYPGHYLRQIKSVTVSLPALVGPYQDVRMTLTQSGSRTLLKADIDGVDYLNDSKTGNASNIITNLRASQQIAVSSGLNDSGLFVLNFGDERYLPFEGTGAVSDWQIAFPNATSSEQQALLASLNDVIIQVHYTAVYGGSTFEQAVMKTL